MLKSVAVVALVYGVEASTFRPSREQVPWLKKLKPSIWVKPDHDIDYPVPSFGGDPDIEATQAHIRSAEGRLNHVMHASFKKPKEHPKDYFVPNFGVDADIKTTQ